MVYSVEEGQSTPGEERVEGGSWPLLARELEVGGLRHIWHLLQRVERTRLSQESPEKVWHGADSRSIVKLEQAHPEVEGPMGKVGETDPGHPYGKLYLG